MDERIASWQEDCLAFVGKSRECEDDMSSSATQLFKAMLDKDISSRLPIFDEGVLPPLWQYQGCADRSVSSSEYRRTEHDQKLL